MPIRFTLLLALGLATIFGWYQLARFSVTAGEQAAAPAQFPANLSASSNSPASQVVSRLAPHIPLLLVFVHPRCSCTPATLEQLDTVLSSVPVPVQVDLVVYNSRALDDTPNLDRLREQTDAAIHNQSAPLGGFVNPLHYPAQLVPDTNGLLARRFGAATSGEVVLYSPDGRLLYQGGITPMRAHIGRTPASDALRTALTTGKPQSKTFSVFGCPIFSLQSMQTLGQSGHPG